MQPSARACRRYIAIMIEDRWSKSGEGVRGSGGGLVVMDVQDKDQALGGGLMLLERTTHTVHDC